MGRGRVGREGAVVGGGAATLFFGVAYLLSVDDTRANLQFHPFTSRLVVLFAVTLVLVGDAGDKGVGGVGISEQRRERQDDLVEGQGRRPSRLEELHVSC